MTTLQEARRRLRLRTPEARIATTADPGALSYYLIGGASLLLLLIGVVMVLSASTIASIRLHHGNPYAGFAAQGMFVMIGLPLMVIASRIPVRWYKALAWPALVSTILLQSLIFTDMARGEGGNENWVYFKFIDQSIQPSEFMKVGLALWLGLIYSRKAALLHHWKEVLVPGILGSLLCLGLVIAGWDMGTAVVLVFLVAGALWVAGVPLWWFAAGGLTGVAGVAALVVMSPSRVTRIMSFMGATEADPTGVDLQPLHGMWALGTGGLTGVGLGASREKWAWLPQAQNDFIFAIVGEELGLLGTLLVLLLFGVLAYGLLRMVRRHPDPFVKITTAAITCWIIGQALINIGVVIGVLPVIGLPLPLVSAGGSAMISTLIALGIMLSFARSEPGARAALSVSSSSVRRSLAVVGGRLVKGRKS